MYFQVDNNNEKEGQKDGDVHGLPVADFADEVAQHYGKDDSTRLEPARTVETAPNTAPFSCGASPNVLRARNVLADIHKYILTLAHQVGR